ncbi:MAG: type I DNA topoisomerase [bacterium]|nr:type I DNA topoisomerase [bacterium]
MAKNLVIVESPAKAKTISRFLGNQYKVLASMGHVRDLPKSKMGIDIEKDFEPSYSVSADKKKVIKELKDELKKADTLWLATDEDREGEAIGWHLLSALKVEKSMPVKRIVFHEITESAIKKSLEEPRDVDMNVVNAQQARRVLDRLVGYELSPLLWKKIRYGLSAGRVQSVAVRLVVEREREIEAFKPEEYWKIIGSFKKENDETIFEAELQRKGDDKLEVKNGDEAKKILSEIEGADYKVKTVEQKEVKKNPSAPFITSTLQQEASRKLNFSVKKTMIVAQQLYEGIDTGKGETGVITYMRTDSVNLSDLATKAAKELITKLYGKDYALDTPRKFKGRKGAQEAHEAIRPVEMSLLPEEAKKYLDNDQARLYELIWKRTVACQMQQAILDKVGVDIEANGYIFRATGQTVKFPGFMEVYMEGKDNEEEEQLGEKFLPKLSEGEKLDLENMASDQHFTKPPPRYTEASLVKKLESEGIGRPSTYAPTITTVINRGYIEKEAKTLRPTDVAGVVTDLLVENFPSVVDYKFTAKMEDNLDDVEEGKLEWVPMLKEFYGPFHETILEKEKTLKKEDIVNEESDEICEKCGKKMMIKLGRFGKFLSCSDYPECKSARPLPGEEGEEVEDSEQVKQLREELKDEKCKKCSSSMEFKVGRYGPYLQCQKEDCKNNQSVVILSGVKCNKCEEGELAERRTRKGGKLFWGCNKFPKCKNATWSKPVGKCEKCGGLKVELKDGVKCKDCEVEKKGVATKKAKP